MDAYFNLRNESDKYQFLKKTGLIAGIITTSLIAFSYFNKSILSSINHLILFSAFIIGVVLIIQYIEFRMTKTPCFLKINYNALLFKNSRFKKIKRVYSDDIRSITIGKNSISVSTNYKTHTVRLLWNSDRTKENIKTQVSLFALENTIELKN